MAGIWQWSPRTCITNAPWDHLPVHHSNTILESWPDAPAGQRKQRDHPLNRGTGYEQTSCCLSSPSISCLEAEKGGGGRRKMVHSWPLVNMTGGGGGVWALGIAFVSWDIWFEKIGGLWKTLSCLAVGVWSTKKNRVKPLNNGKRKGG